MVPTTLNGCTGILFHVNFIKFNIYRILTKLTTPGHRKEKKMKISYLEIFRNQNVPDRSMYEYLHKKENPPRLFS